MRITTIYGKYTIENDNGLLAFKRHGEAWPAADDLRHSCVVLALVQRIEELEDKLQDLYEPADRRAVQLL